MKRKLFDAATVRSLLFEVLYDKRIRRDTDEYYETAIDIVESQIKEIFGDEN